MVKCDLTRRRGEHLRNSHCLVIIAMVCFMIAHEALTEVQQRDEISNNYGKQEVTGKQHNLRPFSTIEKTGIKIRKWPEYNDTFLSERIKNLSLAVQTDCVDKIISKGSKKEKPLSNTLQEISNNVTRYWQIARDALKSSFKISSKLKTLDNTVKRVYKLEGECNATKNTLRELTEKLIKGFALIIIIITVFALFITTKSLRHKNSENIVRMTPIDDEQAVAMADIDTYNLRWEGPKDKSVCVVTFHTATERKHVAETRSLFESTGTISLTIYSQVIRRQADIRDLPGSAIFLIYVDYNQRNVILEHPGTGIGNLRLTTFRSLHKFGSDVWIIYCGDHGSKQLHQELFNDNLTSIYNLPELDQLRKQNRILSIYDHFSDYQKQHCRELLIQN